MSVAHEGRPRGSEGNAGADRTFLRRARLRYATGERRLAMPRIPLLAACALALAAPGAAAQQQPAAETVTVALTSFDFAPETIRLPPGRPVLLRLENRSSGGHNFSAPAFFAAARVDPASAGLVRRGAVEVPSRQVREIRLVPAAGRYRLRCTHTLHTAFGMKGIIVVE